LENAGNRKWKERKDRKMQGMENVRKRDCCRHGTRSKNGTITITTSMDNMTGYRSANFKPK